MLKKETISGQVYYQYYQDKEGGQRTHEGLVANDRFYPCAKAGNRFFFGISVGDRFLPGILWGGRFIPGVISPCGFSPGIFTDRGFQPGVINNGFFMPGIVKGSNLIPGVSRGKEFIQGCYTTDRKFAPGHFRNGAFEGGFGDGDNFRLAAVKQFDAGAVQGLFAGGYGRHRLHRDTHCDGIPIYGTLFGIMDNMLWYLPGGLVTNRGAILGGLHMHNDQLIDKHILTVDFEAILERLGLKKDGPLDSIGDKGEEILDEVQEWMEAGVIIGGSGSSHSSTPDVGGELGKALEELGQGTSELIDNFNKTSQDYWNSVVDHYKGSGSWVAENSTSDVVQTGATVGGIVGGITAAGTYCFMQMGAGLGIKLSVAADVASLGVVAGGAAGIAVFLVIDGIMNGAEETPVEGATGSGGSPPPGSKAADEEGRYSNSVTVGSWGGPKPIEIKNPSVPDFYDVVETEEGKVIVVNRDELKKALQRTSKGTNFGLNILTGATIWRHAHQPTPEEIQAHALHDMFLKMIHDPIWHPDKNLNIAKPNLNITKPN